MANGKTLLTIIQISDLHIGQIDRMTGDAQLNSATQQVFANCGWFDVVLGHHARGLEDLDDFYWIQLLKQFREGAGHLPEAGRR
jgi:hypothetical protein